MKIKDYISQVPIVLDFPYSSDYADEYLENMDLVNFRMRSKYGNLTAYQSDVETIGEDIRSTLFMNKYKYDTIYKTINLEYNPIWNVDGTETITTNHGATEKTDVYADKETTNTQGERKATERRSVFPYDVTLKEETEEEPDNVTEGTETEEPDNVTEEPDNVTEGTETEEPDNVTETEETNKTPKEETDNTTAEVTDTTTEKGRTDKTITAEYTDTITTVKGGNIGVTSTQSLITQERQIAMFSFWDIVISDVVKEITIPFYSEE